MFVLPVRRVFAQLSHTRTFSVTSRTRAETRYRSRVTNHSRDTPRPRETTRPRDATRPPKSSSSSRSESPRQRSKRPARDIPLEKWNPILYEDRAILVLNKPPGYSVQANTPDPKEKMLIGELTSEYMRERGLDCPVIHCHRLDKRTTGALLCAKSTPTLRDITQQFAARKIDKTYLALLHASQDIGVGGTIDQDMGFRDGRPFIVTNGRHGLPAVTRWELLATSPIAPVKLVKFMPETGRKHQIRLHASRVLKAPILGDDLYTDVIRPGRDIKELLSQYRYGTLFLHSASISLTRFRKTGPKKMFRLGLTAPLPRYWIDACKALKIPIPEEYTRSGVFVDGGRVESGIVDGVEGRLISGSGNTPTSATTGTR